MMDPWDIEQALGTVIDKISDENYEQSLNCLRFWFSLGRTSSRIPSYPGSRPAYSETPSYKILDVIRSNTAKTSIDPEGGKLIHPTAHLIPRLARDIESDDLFAPHNAGLQSRLCTEVLLQFFRNNLVLVWSKEKCAYSTAPRDFCVDTNFIAHCANLGLVEEDAVRDHILQSLVSHQKLYDHQVAALIILFKLAGATFETYAGPSVVDRCFGLLKDHNCRSPVKSDLTQEVIVLRGCGWEGLPPPPVLRTGKSKPIGKGQRDPSATPIITPLGLPSRDLELQIPQPPPLESVSLKMDTVPVSPVTQSLSTNISTLSDPTIKDSSDDESPIDLAAITHETFHLEGGNALSEQLGSKAVDQTIPTLLEALRQPGEGSGTALQALKEVMNVRARTVFPIIIPTLIASPMTLFNVHALGSLVTVAGNALSRMLAVIVGALVQESEITTEEELKDAIKETLNTLLGSIFNAEGLNNLMLLLLGWAKHSNPKRRVSACQVFATFCKTSELDFSLYRVDWICQLVTSMNDPEVEVHTAAFQALDTFIKSVPKEEVENLVVPLRRTIESTGAPGVYVPGFSLPKGISPIVPIIIGGLASGINYQKEQAAYAIGELVERTEERAMKPFIVPFAGPLIRVATQATTPPPAVKTAIWTAFSTMLERIPIFGKSFFPPLQRAFVKGVGDPASLAVRTKAAQALGVLMKNQPRVDPVITELIKGARNNEESIAGSFVLALANAVQGGGSNVGDKSKELCVELISDAFKERHEAEPYCQSMGLLFVSLSGAPQLLKTVAQSHLVEGTPATVLGSNITFAVLSADDPEQSGLLRKIGLLRSVAKKVSGDIGSDNHSISQLSRESKDLLKAIRGSGLWGVF